LTSEKNSTMKKQQIIIALSVLLLLILIFFMGRDLFTKPGNPDNPTEYNIDKYRIVDSSKICYKEFKRVTISFENPVGIALDNKGNIYVAGDKSILIFTESPFAGGLLIMKNHISPPLFKSETSFMWPMQGTGWYCSMMLKGS
jgi:hypothetical protein